MTLEIIIFVGAILFGVMLFWRESKNNKLYRFVNKLTNSKKLQMKPEDTKGFLFQQAFLSRLAYIIILYLLIFGALAILVPFNMFTFQLFIAAIVGTTIGTYVASALFVANEKIEDKQDFIEDVLEKGKEILDDIKPDKKIEVAKPLEKPEAIEKEKSGRERLQDKGLM